MNPALRIATYNIHKGVQGIGPRRRLEIHNLGYALRQFDADLICLQEVRRHNVREARHFAHWPQQPQADYLAPEGYQAIYRTNATTRDGEHGNALLTRWPVLGHWHEDMSDHRLEQRGLLHVELAVREQPLHVIVVHLGLIPSSRMRQVAQLGRYIERTVPADAPLVVAGDFNDWGERLRHAMRELGLHSLDAGQHPTFPSRLPLLQLDYVYTRGWPARRVQVPRGPAWAQMSDHLPMLVELDS